MKFFVQKKFLITVFATMVMISAPACFAQEAKQIPDDKVTGEAAVGVLSAYIWRGQELTRHSVVVQPSATINYKGFSANIWGNLDTNPYSAGNNEYSSNFTETDITLSYTIALGKFRAGAGYIYYALAAPYAGGTDPLDSQEVFVTLSLDTILSPTLTIYKEVDHYHQWYATLGFSHVFQFTEMIGLKLAATASYLKSDEAATYPEFDSNALPTADKYNNFHDATVSVALPLTLTKNLTVTPIATYVFPLSDDAGYEMKGRGLQGTAFPADRKSSFLYGGVTASFTF
jgi:hypothetical protein